MSNYLSCVIRCDSEKLVNQIKFLVGRFSRPQFEEDVEPNLIDYYQTIEEIEFPSNVLNDNNYLVLDWIEKDRFDFRHLLPLLKLSAISLVLSHELDSYIGSGDDDEDEQGRYWFTNNGQIDFCDYNELNKGDFEHALNLLNSIRA
jgi:hypothetical protein